MRPRLDGPQRLGAPMGAPSSTESPSSAPAVADLFVGAFRRDLASFFPGIQLEPVADADHSGHQSLVFRLMASPGDDDGEEVELFGRRFLIRLADSARFSPQDRRMVAAIGAVMTMRHHHLFRVSSAPRLDLYRGGSEDHYVSAFIEPDAYVPLSPRPSRIAATMQTLRTAALSTYENRRVSTGALLFGSGFDPVHPEPATPPDALPYGVELTAVKSIYKLCDGKRTLFLVDRAGRLAGIIDVARFAAEVPGPEGPGTPCPRMYHAHAHATAVGGHVCLVLSPNQEIKLFAEGVQAFVFAHGRWRMLDLVVKYEAWQAAVGAPALGRALFQAALNLAEARQGALFVVVADSCAAIGPLIASHDLLSTCATCGPPSELTPRDPVAKRALHYLARGCDATTLDPAVLEALASLDGALATDRAGRLLAFGAILRHDAAELPDLTPAEGARTTAALVASRYGPVLKVSEDGIISCFLDGTRAWEL